MDAQRGSNHERVSEIHSSMGPVGAFDNSPLHLTIEKLNGNNYREWAQAIKLVIDGKGKLGFLTGETQRPPPTDVAASQKWRSENSFITSCLINSMKPSIGKTYMFLLTAKDVWDAIRETYSDAENASQIFEIKTRLWQMKQGDREVTEYYTEMLGLWQELDLSCKEEWECTGDSVRFKKKMENERVFEFLAGLNRELDDVRSRVLSRRPLPSIREVFSEVRREESRRRVMLDHSVGPEGSALLTYGPHGPYAIAGRGLLLLDLVGQAQDSPRGLIVSIIAKLYELFSNFQASGQSSTTLSSGSLAKKDAHHLFSTYSPCAGNLKVKIADGTLSPVAGKGSIRISESITLNPVLHDLSSGKTIGSAKEREGLYYFDETDVLGQSSPTV
ncbi:hypothetical protein CK203_078125 [Vitis vinifera]|uniref:Retrotransposon Copia-like N-terminal domain-containing protein n=1 Tax=Vitis vinifera TaxID=29760 RepID=A0A438ETS7_VITVI|nr:hypothetical protein CK203_078125 [Vitis vinifera]